MFLFYGHLASAAIEMEGQHLTGAQAQVARLLIGRIRIEFAAVPEFEEQAIAASHQMIVCRLHSFRVLIGIK